VLDIVKTRMQDVNLGIREYHIYREQVELEEKEEAFPLRPCILVQFGQANWADGLTYTQVSEPFELTLHLIQDMVNLNDGDQLARFDLIEKVGAALHGTGIKGEHLNGNTPILRRREIIDQAPQAIAHDRIVFEVALKDHSAYYLNRGTKRNIGGLNQSNSLS